MAAVKIDRALILASVAPGALLAVVLGGVAAALVGTLEPAQRTQLWALLEPRIAIVVMLWFFAALGLGVVCRQLWVRHGAAPGRLAEQVQVLMASDVARELPTDNPADGAGSRALAV